MEQKLIIKALNSACGNKNFKFQVITHRSQLHIYANHRADYQPRYEILEANVGYAIASLGVIEFDSVWLHARPLNRNEPNWKVRVQLPTQVNDDPFDTLNTTKQQQADLIESEISPNESIELVGVSEDDSIEDTGLLQDTGFIHKTHFQEEEIISVAPSISPSDYFKDQEEGKSELDIPNLSYYFSEAKEPNGNASLEQDYKSINHTSHQDQPAKIQGSTVTSKLVQTQLIPTNSQIKPAQDLENTRRTLERYCFVVNRQLLTNKTAPPDPEIIRLVKFFHHLTDSNQLKLLPLLERYLQHGETPDVSNMAIAIQKWFRQVRELNFDNQQVFAVWLSRYCYAPNATCEEFKNFAAQNAAALKKPRPKTEYSFTPASSSETEQQSVTELNQPGWQIPPSIKRLILPVAWVCTTLILITLGILLNNNSSVITSQQFDDICLQGTETTPYCRLAVNLAGERAITQSSRSLFPMTEETEASATFGCERYANLKAELPQESINPEQTRVIASSGARISPQVYVAVAEQTKYQQSSTIKVGCVYTTGQRSPKLLGVDTIPTNWPATYYQPAAAVTFGFLTQPINLGLSVIAAALGIAIACRFNLGIKINRAQTFYLGALVLGLTQIFAAQVSFLGIVTSFILPAVAILMLSILIRDFQLNWRYSYALVIVGITAIITIQLLLHSLCLGLINSLLIA